MGLAEMVAGDTLVHERPEISTTFRPEFKSFQKIPRLFRECVITEKLDGTNAFIYIPNDVSTIFVGSRNRWISPGKSTDNYGFAQFVQTNKESLYRLGPGYHYGEWWGCGIARTYNLTERRWSLFNTSKELPEGLPGNVGLVPVLYIGTFDTNGVWSHLADLKMYGSKAVPGYMNPEGVVIFHKASGQLFKVTLGNDGAKDVKSPEES